MNSIAIKFWQYPIGFHISRHCDYVHIPVVMKYAIHNKDYHLGHGLLDNCLKKYVLDDNPRTRSYAIKLAKFLISNDQFPRYLQNFTGRGTFRTEIVDILCRHTIKPLPWTSNLYEKSVADMRDELSYNSDFILDTKYYKEAPTNISTKLRIRHAKQLIIKEVAFDVNEYYRYYCSSIGYAHFRDLITFYHNYLFPSKIQMTELKRHEDIAAVLIKMKENCSSLQLSENEVAFHVISWCSIFACLNKRVLHHPSHLLISSMFICMDAIQILMNNAKVIHQTTFLHALGYFFIMSRIQLFSPYSIRQLYEGHLNHPFDTIYNRYQDYYSALQENVDKLKDMKTQSMTQRFIDMQFDKLDVNYKLGSFKVHLPRMSTASIVNLCKNASQTDLLFYIRSIIGFAKNRSDAEFMKVNAHALLNNEILTPQLVWYYVMYQLSYYPRNGRFLREVYEYIVTQYSNNDEIVGTCTFLYLRGLCSIDPKVVESWMNEYIQEAPFSNTRLVSILNKLKIKGFKSEVEFRLFLTSLPSSGKWQRALDSSGTYTMDAKKRRRHIPV